MNKDGESVHEGSDLISLLFIFALKALAKDFSTCEKWELLSLNDLVIVKSLISLTECTKVWKILIESKDQCVAMSRSKFMVPRLDYLYDFSR